MPWYYASALIGLSLAALAYAYRDAIGDAIATLLGSLGGGEWS